MSFIKTKDGTRLFYQDWGTGKPIVFLHAWAMNSDMWENHMLQFNDRGMRSIAYDRRGHGRSDRSGKGYTYDSFADDLENLLSQLGLDEVTLVGHSMGGGEIIRYLTRHGSGRISRIVLIAATLPLIVQAEDNPNGLDKALFEAGRTAIQKDFPKWLCDNASAFYLPGNFDVSPAYSQWTMNMIQTTSLKAVIEGTYLMSETDFRKELQNVNIPALIIHGSADASIPVFFGRETSGILQDAIYKEYAGAPHGIFFTHIDRLIADIWSFICANE